MLLKAYLNAHSVTYGSISNRNKTALNTLLRCVSAYVLYLASDYAKVSVKRALLPTGFSLPVVVQSVSREKEEGAILVRLILSLFARHCTTHTAYSCCV